MIIEVTKKPGDEARDITAAYFKLRTEATEQATKNQVASGCAICSVYEALEKRGWLKPRTESDYKDHLLARHGLEI